MKEAMPGRFPNEIIELSDVLYREM